MAEWIDWSVAVSVEAGILSGRQFCTGDSSPRFPCISRTTSEVKLITFDSPEKVEKTEHTLQNWGTPL